MESELLKLTGENSLVEALRDAGVLQADENLGEVIEIQDWYRSGAETYLYTFDVRSDGGRKVRCVFKACVAYMGGAHSLNDILDMWHKRRIKVASLGVGTPLLYAIGHGVVFEEYIPLSLPEAMTRIENRRGLLEAAARAAAILTTNGFAMAGAVDWRSHGEDVVLVDFGQDLLWAEEGQVWHGGVLSELIDSLERANARLEPDELRWLDQCFRAGLVEGGTSSHS